MKKLLFSLLLFVNMAVIPTAGNAAISVSGDVVQIAPPVGPITPVFEQISLFEESSGFLPVDITVDAIGVPLVWTQISDGTPGVLPMGTPYRSFYLDHGRGVANNRAIGTVVFDTDILGIIVSAPSDIWGATDNLGITNPILGNPLTTYSTVFADGYEPIPDPFPDTFTIQPDLRTLDLNTIMLGASDQMRVIVAAVPEPSTYLLMSGFLISALFFAHRKMNRAKLTRK